MGLIFNRRPTLRASRNVEVDARGFDRVEVLFDYGPHTPPAAPRTKRVFVGSAMPPTPVDDPTASTEWWT